MRKIQLKAVQNPDLIRFIFDTTPLFDVTILLRNIIVTLNVRQKNTSEKSEVISLFKFD